MKNRIFWSIFFLLFLLFLLPTATYLVTGIPAILGRKEISDKLWFIGHILSGIIVYTVAPFQFSSYLRNKNPERHKRIGGIFIVASLVCIGTLFFDILPNSLCKSCQPSQYISSSFWLLFIILAVYFIRNRRIELHRRFMISGFICAAYFVTIRIINLSLMGLFGMITPNEDMALLVSDIFVWLFPLAILWSIWIKKDFITHKIQKV